VKSLRSSTAIRKPARTLVRVTPAVATVPPAALAGSPSVGRQVTVPLASAPRVALSRLTRIVLLVAVALCLGAPTAGAVPAKKLDNNLAAMWTTILQTPATQNQNPFLTDGCIDLGGTLAPFGGAAPRTGAGPCTVKPGTKIFVAAVSAECSNVEEPPFFGEDELQLRACARRQDVQVAPTVTVDDKLVPVTPVETPLLNIILPDPNVLNVPAQPALSVAHGWVTLLHPLTPGEHTIVGTGSVTFTTKIRVEPGFKP
jgi:hypothetical protein